MKIKNKLDLLLSDEFDRSSNIARIKAYIDDVKSKEKPEDVLRLIAKLLLEVTK